MFHTCSGVGQPRGPAVCGSWSMVAVRMMHDVVPRGTPRLTLLPNSFLPFSLRLMILLLFS
jgi:hypothetical protein